MAKAAVEKERLWGRTPASQKRRVEMMLAAKTVFFEDGYQLASMDRIAEVAGASKRTLYDHFGSKETLFNDCIQYGCENFIKALPQIADLSADPEKGMYDFAAKVRAMITDEESVRFQRTVIAEAERWPAVARLMHQAGVETDNRLAAYLEDRIAAGRLARHDVRISSRLLIDVATSAGRLNRLLSSPDPAEGRLADRALKTLARTLATLHAPAQAA